MKPATVFGVRSVLEAITAGTRAVHRISIAEGRRPSERTQELLDAASRHRIPSQRVSRAQLDDAAGSDAHQGVVAVADPLPTVTLDERLAATNGGLVTVLDGVQDPQNLGAILRTAAAAGCLAVISPRDRAAPLTPIAVKIAEGAAEHVPVVLVTNLNRALGQLKDVGFWIYGLAPEADTVWYDVEMTGGVAVVLGGEEAGLRRLTRQGCDVVARIPMLRSIGSLNVAAAASAALFEVVRQRYRLAAVQERP